MKNLILILLISIANVVFSQDTLTYYVTSSGEKVSQEESKYVRKVFKTPKGLYKVWDYYEDDQLQMTGTFLTDSLKKKTGLFVNYFKNGQIETKSSFIKGKINGESIRNYESGALKYSSDFLHGKRHGKLNTFWENGTKKREDKYINGNFAGGKCYNMQGQEIEHFPFMVYPELPGGKNAIQQFLAKNVRYPAEAKANGVQGQVIVSFTVEKDGSTKNIKIKKYSHHSFNDEAYRVTNLLPKWNPGKQDGELICVSYNLPISFKLRGNPIPPVSLKHYNKGLRNISKEKYNEAINSFSEALKWHPKYKEAYIKRAIAYHKTNQIEKACKDWRISFQLGEKDSQESLDKYCK